jgi:hypothetical protein
VAVGATSEAGGDMGQMKAIQHTFLPFLVQRISTDTTQIFMSNLPLVGQSELM